VNSTHGLDKHASERSDSSHWGKSWKYGLYLCLRSTHVCTFYF